MDASDIAHLIAAAGAVINAAIVPHHEIIDLPIVQIDMFGFDLVREQLHYSFEILEIPSRRGPAPEARACYVEDEETVREREHQTAALKRDRSLTPRTVGRPDKHTRRKLREHNRK